jgi:hypothetical protein
MAFPHPKSQKLKRPQVEQPAVFLHLEVCGETSGAMAGREI